MADRERVARIVRPIIRRDVLGYIHNLNQLEAELKIKVNAMTDQILALFPDIEEAKKEHINLIVDKLTVIGDEEIDRVSTDAAYRKNLPHLTSGQSYVKRIAQAQLQHDKDTIKEIK